MTRTHFLPKASDRRKKNKTCAPNTTPDKTKKGMVNSVVRGVSKLSLCKGTPPNHDYSFQDDGSQTNETASTSRSGTLDFSPLSPCHVLVPCSGRSCVPPVCVPPPTTTQTQDAAFRYPDTLNMRWTEPQFASGPAYSPESSSDDETGILDEEKGWDVDAFIVETDPPPLHSEYDGEDDDPPLSSQTNYAREQLLKCNGYREMLKKSQEKKLKQQQQQHEEQRKIQQQQQRQQQQLSPAEEEFDDYDYDDEDYLCCDEVEISRGLGGYEEGFGVPTMKAHAYHHLPLAIDEEQEEEEEDWSVASSVPDFETFRSHSKSSRTKATASAKATLSNSLPSRQENACIHCLNGTCENEDCSGSRFMI